MGIKIREASRLDNNSLIELFRVKMGNSIQVSLERNEDFFMYQKIQFIKDGKSFVIVNTKTDGIEGCFSIGLKRMSIGGKKKYFQYLSDLRISERFQGRNLLIKVLKYIKDTHLINPNLPCITLSLSDNQLYHSMSDKSFNPELRKRFDIPSMFKWRTIITNFIPVNSTNKPKRKKYFVRKATVNDLKDLNVFLANQFSQNVISEYFDVNDLASDYYTGLDISSFYLAFKNNSIVGIAAIWDQQIFKQTVIRGYSKLFNLIRPILNVLSPITGYSKLPRPGNQITYDIMSHKVVDKKHIGSIYAIASEMLKEIEKKGKMFLMVGCDKYSPELDEIKKFRSRREVEGILYQLNFSNDNNYFYADNPFINLEISRI